VKSSLQLGEQTRVVNESPRPTREVDAHRWAGRALEDQICAIDAHDLGRGIAAFANVTHDGDLAGRHVVPAETTQDGTRIERVHVRVTAACERL
jgi:hypothetical protein